MAVNSINILNGRVVESFNGLTGHVTKQIFKVAEYDGTNPFQINFLDENNALIDSIILDAANIQNLPALDQDNKFRVITIPSASLTTQDEEGVAEFLNVGLTISDKEVIIVRIINGDKFFLTGLGKGEYGGVNTLITVNNLLKFDALEGVSTDPNQALTTGADGKVFLDESIFAAGTGDRIIYFNDGYQGGLEYLWTARWEFGGTTYILNQDPQTAATADPTFDRIAVFALNSDGTGSIIEGTPALNPVEPSIDPLTQLKAAIIIIKAGALTPDGVTTGKVYDENAQVVGGEYNTANFPAAMTRFVLNSTTKPLTNTISIEGTLLQQFDAVEFTPDAPILLSDLSSLGYSLFIKAGNYNKHRGDAYRIQFIGTDAGANPVNLYLPSDPSFDISNSTSWQNLAATVPQDSIMTTLTKIRFVIWTASNLSFGLWLDNIFTIKGTSNPSFGDYATVAYVDQQDALKVDKIAGYGLSQENYTLIEKQTVAKFFVPETQDLIPVSQLDGSIVWEPKPSGTGSGDKNYVHDQGTASAIWTIAHGLGKYPTPHVLDTANNEVEGEIIHTDINNLTIEFNAPFSGKATLN